MLDFFEVSTRSRKRGVIEVLPRFLTYRPSGEKISDLMVKGGDFYAVWDETKNLWSTDESHVIKIIDDEVRKRYEEERDKHPDYSVVPLYLRYADSGMIDDWHKYCQKQLRDSFHMLDENVVFSNTQLTKELYASKSLNYPLEEGSIDAYDRVMSVLYSPEERHKIEWAIGSIVTGDAKENHKFMVLYGDPGTGKSTVLDIVELLFNGYTAPLDAKAIGSNNASFSLESLSGSPLVGIQHEADLSRIEDNTKLNSIVSHDLMPVNAKYQRIYKNRFKAFLFLATNKPVKITDSKSGLIRRLIDVKPTGNKIPRSEFNVLKKQIKFELGAIAYHCKKVYLENPSAYDDYIPIRMFTASNDLYNFLLDNYNTFKKNDGVSRNSAWEMYRAYCVDANVKYPLVRMVFTEEMKSYFKEFFERYTAEDGKRYRSYYKGFRVEKFKDNVVEYDMGPTDDNWIELKEQESKFDEWAKLYPAQYAKKDESPRSKWDKVTTTLQDLDTRKLHYVNIPEETNLIFMDFDLRDENGEKSLEKNLEAAKNFPKTYVELSKGGQGLHLIYIYEGDVSKLAFLFSPGIEIKTCVGNSAMRRKLIKCNDIPIAKINTGLPLKGDDKQVVDKKILENEKELRNKIRKCLRREVHANTAPNISFIFKLIEEAKECGIEYDISDMKRDIEEFALQSTNQKEYCLDLVKKMRFKSSDDDSQYASVYLEELVNTSNMDVDEFLNNLIIFDIEVVPNLLLVCWKKYGVDQINKMFNPTPAEVADLVSKRLGGYNNLAYDNIILYARMLGEDNKGIYEISKSIIKDNKRGIYGFNARNISTIDVYDMLTGSNRKGLKRHEIELKIPHEEMDISWDEPLPEDKWEKLAHYCANDVMATEAVINKYKSDLTTRLMLSDVASMPPNTTTNSLTSKIILGGDKNAASQFRWRDLSEPVYDLDEETYDFLSESCPEMMSVTHGEAGSLLPYFPGYEFKYGKSTYRNELPSEGGYVYAEPGSYTNVVVLDIASMHPASIISEMYFGKYTKNFRDLRDVRVDIKHGEIDKMNYILDGKLKKYADGISNESIDPDSVGTALKTPINSVYGLTAAKFENPFFNPKNKDNFVAKRGALFMIDLKYAVQERGFIVAHIKTDSIKIPNATKDIIKFVKDFGNRYGYSFEHESTYEKMCLVNDAVYVAKYMTPDVCNDIYGYVPSNNKKHFAKNEHPWTATGTQFQVPYVFKTLFSGEPLVFDDFCEIKQVKSTLYLDMNEDCPDVKNEEKILSKAETDYKKGLMNDTSFNDICNQVKDKIASGHKYHFIGRVGQFTPVKPGIGGGLLVKFDNDKYYAVTGTKGYRWMESSMVQHFGLDKYIDTSYYNKLVEKAVEAISKYCDIDWFRADDDIDISKIDKSNMMPCGDFKYPTCFDCPYFNDDEFHMDCERGYDISEIIMNKPVDE